MKCPIVEETEIGYTEPDPEREGQDRYIAELDAMGGHTYWAAGDDEEECAEKRRADDFGPDYHCTRAKGHVGCHIAHTADNRPLAAWGEVPGGVLRATL